MISESVTAICDSCERSYYIDRHRPHMEEVLNILSSKTETRALCGSCLISRINELINQFFLELTEEKIRNVQQLGRPKYLINGIDYYINESGLWVFTKWYLLRKGDCCGSGCLNCPY